MTDHDRAFGVLQKEQDFPDELTQGLRKVFEAMYRAGFRDWEVEWDYAEGSPWFLRRGLEVHAREAFRHWFGEEKWQVPFRMACHLQETGSVEYRIDHLLQTALGVAVRPRAVADSQAGRRRPRYGEVPQALRTRAKELLPPGEFFTADVIASRLQPAVEFAVPVDLVYQYCYFHSEQFDWRRIPGKYGPRAQFAVRPELPPQKVGD